MRKRHATLARQLDIDDRTLETGKLAVMRSEEEVPIPGKQELRLVGEQDGDGDAVDFQRELLMTA